MSDKAVVFFSDRNMLPGLHAALVSLLLSNPAMDADTYVFLDKVSANEKEKLLKTWTMNLHSENKRPLFVVDFKPTAIGNRLHGNSTTYGRLYLGELLPNHSKCIYIDSDTIVLANIQDMFALIQDDMLLAADCTCHRNWSLEKQLFIAAGIDLNGNSFNAGVLAINLDSWRRTNAFRQCEDVAKQFAGLFSSADQALLNVTFHDKVIPFGERYNTPLGPNSVQPVTIEERIYHFVGSPKPWDLFGSNLHKSFNLWHSYYSRSAMVSSRGIARLNFNRIIRTSRQLLYAWKHRQR